MTGEATEVRPWALSGIWGREVQLIYDDAKFSRAPVGENVPISMWSNRWSTMPVMSRKQRIRLPMPDDRAYLDKMPGSNIPVIRQPFVAGDMLPFWAMGGFEGDHMYDLGVDPDEEENRASEKPAAEAAHNLRDALKSVDAPDEQLERLGLL